MQTRSHNVVRESFAVTKDVSGIQVPADLSKPLITVEMVNIIVRKTNEKTVQLHQKSVKNIQMLCGIGKK
ncbi:putative endonuclease [Trichinella spiralis]|uniref:putative endonuclease n=1 Tax=Trichinella spiralis TaxID=6334 RepID=UPI0001EFDA37|nr:putative endonuclease [Trichinella spiralis]